MEMSIKNIIRKSLEGNSTKEEKAVLLKWLSESEENTKMYLQLKDMHQFERNTDAISHFDSDKAFATFQANTQNSKRLHPFIFKIAAAIAILITGFITYSVMRTSSEQSIKPIIVQTLDSTMHKNMPDGSIVSINRNSQVSFSSDFNVRNRNIFLKGEAYFDVEKNADFPFIVKTKHLNVLVTGTVFNVKSDSLEKVCVQEGTVRVSIVELGKDFVLQKGDVLDFNPKDKTYSKEENVFHANDIAWKTGVLSYNFASLQEVTADLSNYYNKIFIIEDSLLFEKKITTTFNNVSLESALKILNLTLNLSYSQKNDTIQLHAIN